MTTTLLKKKSPYSHWECCDQKTGDLIRVVPDRGGLITEWICNGKDILYFDLDRFHQKEKSIRGGIPILFPICGDLPGNHLTINDSQTTLNQHGFARNYPWNIYPLDNNQGFGLSLLDNQQSILIYPFSFSISIDVELNINSLQFNIRVTNLSRESMPFSFGLHPYFIVNDLQNVQIERLPASCIDHLSNSNSNTSNLLKQLYQGVDFLVEANSSVLHDLSTNRKIELRNQKPMDLTVVWTDPPRKMVCLEPWTSPRRSLITGDRQITLEYRETQELTCQIISIE